MIDLDSQLAAAIKVLDILNNHGHKAFFVGGFVRDYLLHIPTDDIDIATDATPGEVAAVFPLTKPTGVKYGTVTVFVGKYKFEVTTFRKEGGYIDYRHPETIYFSDSLEEDLKRRDFTINAMAMSAQMEVIDPFNGRDDLKKRLIRAVGDPNERFQEDALRILRAFRFVAKLGFSLEEKTSQALVKSIGLLEKIASERIIGELEKIISYPKAHLALKMMHEHQMGDAIKDLKKALELISTRTFYNLSVWEFYALSFYLMGYTDIPKEWRFSNKERKHIAVLTELVQATIDKPFSRLLVYRYGLDLCLSANRILMYLGQPTNQEDAVCDIWNSLPIRSSRELDFGAEDIKTGWPEIDERLIGSTIDEVVNAVVIGKLQNNKDEILEYVKKILEKKRTELE